MKPGMKEPILISCLLLVAGQIIHAQPNSFPELTGPYLGQKPPGDTPEVFAPEIVSTKTDEYAVEISPSGKEMMFVRNFIVVLMIKNSDGIWNKPVAAPFSGKYIEFN